MDRIKRGAAPLLFNHNWNDPIGMIDGGRIKDGRLYVDAHLFDTARSKEVEAMVRGGLRNVSVGYEIEEITEDKKTSTYTATRWLPLEGSICTVPADAGVGIGRQADDEQAKPVRVVRAASEPAAQAASPGVPTMAETQAVAAAPQPQVIEDHTNRPSVEQMEQHRQMAIRNFAKSSQCDERYVERWIREGTSLEDVSNDLIKIMATRSDKAAVTFLDMPAKDVANYSVTRALRAALSKDWTHAGLELEANKALCTRLGRLPKAASSFFVPLDAMVRQYQPQQRDMTVAGVSGSNYLVGTTNLAGSFIEMLRNESVALSMGVTKLSGLQGNVTIPKMTAATRPIGSPTKPRRSPKASQPSVNLP
jgi:HK97 family phage prohead protease